LTDTRKQVTYSYIVSVVGVALVTIAATLGLVRVITIREASREGFGNRQPGNVNPVGFASSLTILGVLTAIIGLAWLGMALRRSRKDATQLS
jgi:formate hydrogenlyase subunit 3/multisubunit Na+/H+ antiporter MnhD subunit